MYGKKALCSVCNVTLNSPEQLEAHLAGKAHKKKLAAAENPGNMVVPASVANVVVKAKSLIRFVGSQEGSLGSVSKNIAKIEDGSGDQKVAAASGQNVETEATAAMVDIFYCEVCKVKLTSKSQADMHYSGAKHRRALAVKSGSFGTATTDGQKRKLEDSCQVCNVPITSKTVADAHYSGSKHQKKMKLSQLIGVSQGQAPNGGAGCGVSQPPAQTSTWLAQSIKMELPLLTSSADTPTDPGCVGQEKKLQAGSLFFCSFCKVSVNSQQQMDAHREGSKHKSAVSGASPQPKKPFTPRTPANNSNRFTSPTNANNRFVSPASTNNWFASQASTNNGFASLANSSKPGFSARNFPGLQSNGQMAFRSPPPPPPQLDYPSQPFY